MHCTGKFVFVLSLLLLFPSIVAALEEPETAPPKHEIPETKYPTADAFVISYNIMDFAGADNSGKTDMAPLIRKLLRRLEGSPAKDGGVGNGGVLFLPEGKYLLESNLIIPKGVTIRGEWRKPEKGKPIVGTIIVSDFGRGEETSEKSLIILEPAAGVKDLAFWYPKQVPENIVPYPPTIGFGAPKYYGNEYCVAQNVTFVNAYSGAVLLYGGGAPNMFGLYGTPLKRGIEIDFIAEVGRVEGVGFAPDYWIGSGLPGSPRDKTKFKSWLRQNGTGVVMRRNDWSFTSNMAIEGYAIGFHLVRSTKENATPNGQNFRLRFTDCRVALCAQSIASVGAMFHDVRVDDCDHGIYVPKNADGTLQITRWSINAKRYAIGVDENVSMHLLAAQSSIESGSIECNGGTQVFLDTDINTERPQLKIGPESRVIMAGNRFKNKVGVVNRSMYECVFDGKPLADFARIPDFPYKDPQTIRQKPERTVLYVATDPEYGVKPNDNSFDNTQPLQRVLDRAGKDGGGVVYLPPGKYRILGNLILPAGVELKGATDIGSVPLGPGSILEVYADKDKPDGPPLLTMQERSGLRGIVFNYPEQIYNELLHGEGEEAILNPHTYPYAVRVAGNDAYLVNVGFRATFSGIDLFTHRCDNVYIEYPSGHLFTNGIRVGAGTENARICNAQFNTIGYACGDESKFGRWPNARTGKDNQAPYRQNWRDLRFFILEDCRNLLLFNNFYFGCHVGTTFGGESGAPSGLALGHGIDAAVKALYFNRIGEGGFDLIGSQIVSLRKKVENCGDAARYIETSPDFSGTVNMFVADFWGSPFYATEMGGGKIVLQLARFNNAGSDRMLEARSGNSGRFRLVGSSVNVPSNRSPINEGEEKRFVAEHSIIDAGPMNTEVCGGFTGNLSGGPKMLFKNNLDRSGWAVTTSRGSGEKMLDDDVETRWGTGRGMQKDDWIVLDMSKPQSFNTIVLNQGKSGGDFPQRYDVFVSDDGEQWGDAVIHGEGTQGMTVVRFPTEQNKRYLKIVVVEPKPAANIWWSVAEIQAALLKYNHLEPPFENE